MQLNQVCYRTLQLADPAKLYTYESIGGYTVWRKILVEKPSANSIINIIKSAELIGRGGAGFPAWVKWDSVLQSRALQKYIICNSDEGEPGAFKDRDILNYNPHQIIEGMAIAGYAIGASVGYHYIRGEYSSQITIMEAALKEARKAGLIGENINGSGIDFQIYTFYGAGAYICGEETALIESIEGKRGQPRIKPPFPTSHGLYGSPTLVNNTETLASVPVILAKGSEWYTGLGINKNKGCKIFSISGHVNKPGNYEVPLGIHFAELLALAGGMRGNKKLKAVIPGGVSTPILPADIIMNLAMDYGSLRQVGSELGTGSVIIMDEDTCMVQILARILRFYFHESCGKCTPCREGVGWVARILNRILYTKGNVDDLKLLTEVIEKISTNSLCALGSSVPIVVAGFLKYFSGEFERARGVCHCEER